MAPNAIANATPAPAVARPKALAKAEPKGFWGRIGDSIDSGASWLKKKGEDLFYKSTGKGIEAGQKAARGLVGLAGPGRSMLGEDGKTTHLRVNGADHRKSPVLYVNGALQNLDHAKDAAKQLGSAAHRDVDLIYNATHVPQYDNPVARTLSMVGHSRKDAYEVLGDHLGKGHNPSVVATRARILSSMEAGGRLDIAAQSAGVQVVARALTGAADTRRAALTKRYGAAAAERRLQTELGRIKVLNISGAARRGDFPAGIRYRHIEQPNDPVAKSLGENAGPKRDQEYLRRLQMLGFGLIFSAKEHAMPATLERHKRTVDDFL